MGSDERSSTKGAESPLLAVVEDAQSPTSVPFSLKSSPIRNAGNTEVQGEQEPSEPVNGQSSQPIASAAITRTIHELESLLEEAVKIVELVDANHHFNFAQNVEGLSNSPGHYTEATLPVLPKDHNNKAKPPRQVSFAEGMKKRNQKEQAGELATKSVSAIQTCRGACNADNLQLLAPEPFVEISTPDHPYDKDGLSTKPVQSRLTRPKLHQPPDIAPRVTSIRGRAKQMLNKHSLPKIKFENVDVKSQPGWGEESKQLLDDEDKYLRPHSGHKRHFSDLFGVHSRAGSAKVINSPSESTYRIDLNGIRHVDVPERAKDIDVHETYHPSPVARNWSNSRKQIAALVACINTACIGFVLGIYAGEVPAIQYVVVDFHRVMILGNVGLYCGLAISTLIFWPLPLLHGRKPYTIAGLTLSLCLQIPQGLAVMEFHDPSDRRYRIILLLSRAISGFVFGFVNINVFATLLDVFGASLKSSRSNNDLDDPNDVRRHGGGMGVWLAVVSWCSIGSIALGFMIGAFIISSSPAS